MRIWPTQGDGYSCIKTNLILSEIWKSDSIIRKIKESCSLLHKINKQFSQSPDLNNVGWWRVYHRDYFHFKKTDMLYIYTLLCCSKPVWLSVFCEKILWRILSFWNFGPHWLSLYRKKYIQWNKSKYTLLCSAKENKSYRFEMCDTFQNCYFYFNPKHFKLVSAYSLVSVPSSNPVPLWAPRVWIPARGPFPIPLPSLSPNFVPVITLSYLNKVKMAKKKPLIIIIVIKNTSSCILHYFSTCMNWTICTVCAFMWQGVNGVYEFSPHHTVIYPNTQ